MLLPAVFWTCVSFLANEIAVSLAIQNSRIKFDISDFRKCLDTDKVSVVHMLVKPTLPSCVEHCVARGDCQAVNYRRRFKLCELLNDVKRTNVTIENDALTGGCVSVYMDTVTNSVVDQGCSCEGGQSCDIKTHSCSITECPVLTLENGEIDGNLYEVGSILRFHCHVYHTEKNGMNSSTCLTTGQWSYLPECQVDCGEPQTIKNANISEGSTSLDSIRTYYCKEGYTMVYGGNTDYITTCISNATWTPVLFTCVIGKDNKRYKIQNKSAAYNALFYCGVPQTIQYAQISEGSTLLHSTRTYYCMEGYSMILGTSGYSASTVCKVTGDWSIVDFTCVIDCGEPPTVAYALPFYSSTVLSSICTYTCNYGFAPQPEAAVMEIQCGTTGIWSSVTFACVVDCGVPQTIQHAQISEGSTLLHSTRTYYCMEGYSMILGTSGYQDSTVCKVTGDWSIVDFTCVVDCGEPPTVAYALSLCSSTVLSSICTYTCNNGFAPQPETAVMETQCGTTGIWSSVTFACVVDCGSPPEVTNASVSSGSTLIHASRSYTCSNGFAVSPEGSGMDILCRTDGSWSTITFTCVVDCGEPPVITNTMISSGSTLVFTERTYTCLNGYGSISASNSITTLCQYNGLWSTVYFSCVIDCGAPSDISDATVSSGSTLEGSIRSYTCNSGYTASTSTTVTSTTCDSNGLWSAVSLTCVPEAVVGNSCSTDSDCTETGTVCLYSMCFCGPTYRYESATKQCRQVCNTVTNGYTYIPSSYISAYNILGGHISYSSQANCESECSSKPDCLSFDYFSYTEDCFLNSVSYYMVLDTDSESIITSSTTLIGYKICV
ncbi:hypothetical protein ACF0H5_015323 [Mactra antiquata]